MPRFVREPLFQFLVIGAVVFGLYAFLQGRTASSEPDVIVVSQGRVAQLVDAFSRTWQRQPTEAELQGLINAFVKEEIFYREGRRLGLDTNDTIFRRRLQQKMEFLVEPSPRELVPGDGELEAFLQANPDKFKLPTRVAFEQIFFDPARRGGNAEADAGAALAQLTSGNPPATESLGDQTLLPAGMPLSPAGRIESRFGAQFADALSTAPVGEWSGPVRSTFGLHLVRVEDREDERVPQLDETIEAVTREWRAEKRRAIAKERYEKLRDGYEIVIETVPDEDTAPTNAATE